MIQPNNEAKFDIREGLLYEIGAGEKIVIIKKLIRKNSPNGVILAMKSTEKHTLSFQKTIRP